MERDPGGSIAIEKISVRLIVRPARFREMAHHFNSVVAQRVANQTSVHVGSTRATPSQRISPWQFATSADPPPVLRNEPAFSREGMSNVQIQMPKRRGFKVEGFRFKEAPSEAHLLLPTSYFPFPRAPPRNTE
jgi:hypothetical protein